MPSLFWLKIANLSLLWWLLGTLHLLHHQTLGIELHRIHVTQSQNHAGQKLIVTDICYIIKQLDERVI